MSFKILWEDHIKNMKQYLNNRVDWDEDFNSGDYWYNHIDSSSPIANVITDSSHTTPQTTPWIIACKPGYVFNRRYSYQGNNNGMYRGYLGSTYTVNKQFGTYDYDTHTYTGNKPLIEDNNGKKYYNAMVIATQANAINSPAIFPGQLYDTPTDGTTTGGVWKSIGNENQINAIYNSGQATIPITEDFVVPLNPVVTTYTITNTLTNCTTNNSATQVEEDDSYNATITPDASYNLSGITVTMDNVDITSSVVTTVNNTYVINITNVTGNVSINATAVYVVTYTITNTLTNCTTNNSATSVVENSAYTATISARSSSYGLDSITVTMDNVDITSSVATESNNKYILNIPSVTGNVVIVATAILKPTYTVTNTLDNKLSNSNSRTTLQENSSYTATISTVAGNDYHNTPLTFKINTLTVTMGGIDITNDVVTEVNDWNYNISINNVIGNVVITGTSVQILDEKTISYQIPHSQNNIAELSTHIYNMLSVNDSLPTNPSNSIWDHLFTAPITGGSQKTGTTIYIWAETGYGVNEDDLENLDIDFDLNLVYWYTDSNNKTKTITYNFTDEDILWVGDINDYYNNGNIDPITIGGEHFYCGMVIDVAAPFLNHISAFSDRQHIYPNVQMALKLQGNIFSQISTLTTTEFPMTYVYNPTYQQLEDVAQARYTTPSVGTTPDTTVDLSKFILKVYKTYVDFDTSGVQSDVILGNVNTNVLSDVIVRNPSVYCGTVILTENQQNVLDYSPFTQLQIYLPFIGIKDLDIDVIRDKAIKLYYKVNVMTGKCLATLCYNNMILYQFEGTIGEDIPFATNTSSTAEFSVVRGGENNPLTMGTNYPYFIITTNVGYAPDKDIDGLAQYESALIGDYTGCVRVKNVELETTATEEEKNQIENLLKLGVVIEEVSTP